MNQKEVGVGLRLAPAPASSRTVLVSARASWIQRHDSTVVAFYQAMPIVNQVMRSKQKCVPGVHTCAPFEEGMLRSWMGGLVARPLGWGVKRGLGWVGLAASCRSSPPGSGHPSLPDHEAEPPDGPAPRPSGAVSNALTAFLGVVKDT